MTEDSQLAAVRRKKIVDLVADRGSVAVRELSGAFGVSEATIRRDLKELGDLGAVTRTHGGVMTNASTLVDLPNAERMLVGSDEKRRIGRAAIDMLAGDEVVFLDAGTTALAVANYAYSKPDCRYVTTCLRIASVLRDQDIPNFYLIGGSYRVANDSFAGTLAIGAIRTLTFDISFLCCSAIDLARQSISIVDEAYSQIQKEIVAVTRRNIVVAHHEKVDTCGFIRTAAFDDLDGIITSSGMGRDSRALLEKSGIEVIFA